MDGLFVIAIRGVRDVVAAKVKIAEREEFVGSESSLLHWVRLFLRGGGYRGQQDRAGENEDLETSDHLRTPQETGFVAGEGGVVPGVAGDGAGEGAAELLLVPDLKNVESNCAPPTAAAMLIMNITAGLS